MKNKIINKIVILSTSSLLFVISACGTSSTNPITSEETKEENKITTETQLETDNVLATYVIETETESEVEKISVDLNVENISDYIDFIIVEEQDNLGNPTYILTTASKQYSQGFVLEEENNVSIEITLSDGSIKTIHNLVSIVASGEKDKLENIKCFISKAVGEIKFISIEGLSSYEIKNEERKLTFKDGSEIIEMLPDILEKNPY